jgi:phosphoglucosamine mutase
VPRRLFGTDGVRGLANGDLTPQLAMSLALSAVGVLRAGRPLPRPGEPRPRVVVGSDGRASGEMLEAAVTAGLTSGGVDVLRVGVLPTPAVAYLVGAEEAAFGVVLSASHNPMPDNGVKFFGPGGEKLDEAVEAEIEDRVFEEWDRPTGAGVGRVGVLADAEQRYRDHVVSTAPTPLAGLRVVVDCGNGAASSVAPAAYRAAGAQVVAINTEPTGLNINDRCGSTHLDALQAAVLEHGADVGIAHDGDADRCLAVDAEGRVVDGDAILAVCALGLRDAGRLAGDAVVTTVMTNLGFRRAMAERGIGVVQTPVGDRHVLAALHAHGLVLGGEQSGHLVFLDHASTGDGLVTALQLLSRVVASGRPLAELTTVVHRLPQVLLNVRVADRTAATEDPAVLDAVARAEAALGADGRVLLRASGTEALVRVMVEAPTEHDAHAWADEVAAAVARAAG